MKPKKNTCGDCVYFDLWKMEDKKTAIGYCRGTGYLILKRNHEASCEKYYSRSKKQ